MRREWTNCLLLVVALIQPLAWAGEVPAPSELGRLEQVLSQAQQEKDQGQLKPERYHEFLLQFRGSLDIAWAANARSAEDSATYARIIARLGDHAQALAVLGPALEQAPDDPDLRLTSGEVRFEQKDYPAALAEANAVLAKDPGNRRALGLKHFSKGRISGAPASSAASPHSGPAEGGSIWNDPRIVAAGRRATGRRNAIHFMDQAMSRLKIADPREALRFLALAEVSDPASPDVPMQQGLAYMDLKAPGKALGRFSQAEAMWQAKGHANAALARALRERAATELTATPQEAVAVGEMDRVKNIKSSSFVRGFMHYIGASATPRRVDFNELDTSGIRAINFPAVAAELNEPALEREVSINSRIRWAVPGASRLLLGDITLLLKGRLTFHRDCRWSFQGSLRAFDDVYDFNKAQRAWLAESLTMLGRNTPGKIYKVEIRGVRPVSEAGTKEKCQ